MNVHGFNDINNPGSAQNLRAPPERQNNSRGITNTQAQNQQHNWAYSIQNLKAVQTHRVLFLSGNSRMKNPKDQNYFDMLRFTWCPVIKCCSITTLILLIQLGLFIASVVIGLNKSGQLLQVQAQTLLKLGANHSPSVLKGQVYRLVVPQFLHVHFMHLVGNFFTTLIFMSRVQYTYGPIKTLIIYIISGIGGNIFSDLVNPQQNLVKAGASTSLYGIIGSIIGYIILNWRGLNIIGKLLKCQLMFISLIIILFIFVLTPYGGNIDYLGHLGGFLIGVTLCAIHQTIRNDKRQKIMRFVFLLLCVAMFLVWFLIFYLRK